LGDIQHARSFIHVQNKLVLVIFFHLCDYAKTVKIGDEIGNLRMKAGLPDGLFLNKKIPIWVNFEGACSGKSWYIS
jgi:hypothetical protein